MIETLILLIAAHFICDTVLQPPHVSQGKNPFGIPAAIPKHIHRQTIWFYFMAGHAATHGLAVYLITGQFKFFVLEIAYHFAIDFHKCKGTFGNKYQMHIDQALHIACKVMYCLALLNHE